MLRSVLSAILLAGLLAAAQPTVADPLAATASAHVQAAAAMVEQPASLPAKPAVEAVPSDSWRGSLRRLLDPIPAKPNARRRRRDIANDAAKMELAPAPWPRREAATG